MKNPTIRKPLTGRERTQFNTTGESRTHLDMAPECDINTIMKKYEKTGILEHRNTFGGSYGDFSNAPEDYHSAVNSVIEANDMFDSLPSSIRKRFHNDPGAFVEFATNADNQDELIKLGLAVRTAEDVIEKTPTPAPKKTETPSTAKKETPATPSKDE